MSEWTGEFGGTCRGKYSVNLAGRLLLHDLEAFAGRTRGIAFAY